MKKILLTTILLFSVNTVQAVQLSSIINPNESLIVADKKNGKIYTYNAASKEIKSSPALYGKTIADDFASDNDRSTITPSGTFTSSKAFSTHLNEDVTAFLKRGKALFAIHPVWTGTPAQRRPQRLASPEPEDNRITNGCINVPKTFYYDIIDKIKSGTTVKVLMENEVLEDDVSGTDFLTNVKPVIPVIYNEVKTTTTEAPLVSVDEMAAGAAGAAGLY